MKHTSSLFQSTVDLIEKHTTTLLQGNTYVLKETNDVGTLKTNTIDE